MALWYVLLACHAECDRASQWQHASLLAQYDWGHNFGLRWLSGVSSGYNDVRMPHDHPVEDRERHCHKRAVELRGYDVSDTLAHGLTYMPAPEF